VGYFGLLRTSQTGSIMFAAIMKFTVKLPPDKYLGVGKT